MDNSTEAIVVMMTAASQDEASRIAEMLVGQRLAACVQILPEIESVYRWQGEVKRSNGHRWIREPLLKLAAP